MNAFFSPQLEILPEPQKKLWEHLKDTPKHFTLYGGTALALHLGHRESVDFDFFSNEELRIDTLLNSVPYLKPCQIIQNEPNALSVRVDCDGIVKVSFFGNLGLNHIHKPHVTIDNGLKIASLIDLAATKVKVVQDRAEAKDYIDIYALLDKTDIDLPKSLAAAQIVYGQRFNPYLSLKALSYFDDGNLKALTPDIRDRLAKAVRETDLDRLPEITREQDYGMEMK